MSDSVEERGEAIGWVLSDIAGACLSIRALIDAGRDSGDLDAVHAMLAGIDALASRAGSLADRAGRRVTHKIGGIQSADEWAHPQQTLKALKMLEGVL